MYKFYFIKIVCFFMLVTFFPAKVALSQSADKKLNYKIREVEKAIKEGEKRSRVLKRKADNLKIDISKAGQDRINIAYNVQNLEQRLSRLENEISDLNKAESEKRNLLLTRKGQFTRVLMALQRISRIPPEAVIVYPKGTDDLIRTAILLKSAVPKIEIQASQLREDLNALAATRELISDRQIQLKNTSAEFIKKRRYLDGLIARKAKQHKNMVSERRQAASTIRVLSSKVRNLRELFGKLAEKENAIGKKRIENTIENPSTEAVELTSRQKAKRIKPSHPYNLKPFALSRGSLRYPAVGRISKHYGQTIRRGVTSKGLTIETRASAQVVAPYNGKVVYAGNFRGYGQLLIIDHGEGYHTLLAGMDRIDGIMGQYLLLGEPVGIMGIPKKGSPKLYVELRRNSQPINPIPWLTKRKFG